MSLPAFYWGEMVAVWLIPDKVTMQRCLIENPFTSGELILAVGWAWARLNLRLRGAWLFFLPKSYSGWMVFASTSIGTSMRRIMRHCAVCWESALEPRRLR
jgi:hypothetical protein